MSDGNMLKEPKTVPEVQLSPSRGARRSTPARERILEIAQAAVLSKGFAATSIEEVISEAGITKSGFFYHFKDKTELAHEMLRRYIDENNAIFDDIFGRGRELSDDPLQAYLIGLKLMAETMSQLPSSHPGCLIAAICYQERLFDRDVRDLSGATVTAWNSRFLGHLEEIAAVHPLTVNVELEDLARMLSCIIDGAIIMSRVLHEPRVLERQVLAYRAFVKAAFAPA